MRACLQCLFIFEATVHAGIVFLEMHSKTQDKVVVDVNETIPVVNGHEAEHTQVTGHLSTRIHINKSVKVTN